MILVALGSNRTGPWGNPRQTVLRALAHLDRGGLRLVAASRLMVTEPFGLANQPPFVNAVARILTHLPPEALLRRLHTIERLAGRQRRLRWGPRTLDLDLLDYNGLRRPGPVAPVLPHPGIAERIFVLKPIAEMAPRWRHPQLQRTAAELLRRLDPAGEGGEIA
ncbi:MAG: 2-amino-4-hydroxy-6-hydroxymethyldihydropteridine diphosphokinase [Alphaproteobacteria bacterium]|nr:2-amino-4-hydroxy-6-hydroxymethyldihydropteridine diphosphokinase [Alphaproteobacteria bacterium]